MINSNLLSTMSLAAPPKTRINATIVITIIDIDFLFIIILFCSSRQIYAKAVIVFSKPLLMISMMLPNGSSQYATLYPRTTSQTLLRCFPPVLEIFLHKSSMLGSVMHESKSLIRLLPRISKVLL